MQNVKQTMKNHEAEIQLANARLAVLDAEMKRAVTTRNADTWMALFREQKALQKTVKTRTAFLESHHKRLKTHEATEMVRAEENAALSARVLDQRHGVTEDRIKRSVDVLARERDRVGDIADAVNTGLAEAEAKLLEDEDVAGAAETTDSSDSHANEKRAFDEACERAFAADVSGMLVPADDLQRWNGDLQPVGRAVMPTVQMDQARQLTNIDAMMPTISDSVTDFALGGAGGGSGRARPRPLVTPS
jgi:hypothetical protein